MIKQKLVLSFLFGLSGVSGLSGETESAGSETKPNILIIMSDDQGSGDIGYNNPLVKTPVLDRLAKQSAVFTDFISHPACSPARASFLTGRNFMSTGVWGVGQRGYINRDEVFLPEYLRRAGYRTAHFGKWGEGWTPDQRPYMRGYEVAASMAAYQHQDPQLDHNGTLVQEKGWTVDVLADLTIGFIRSQTEAKHPWFAVTAYISPHTPWECDPSFSEPLEAAGYSKALATLYGMIHQMDTATGRIIEEINRLGIAGNTIVIFVSDNGATPGSKPPMHTPVGSDDWERRNPLHLRGEKATAWQNGIRVPFFINWPGHILPGTRPQTASIEDILPTLLDLTGVPSSVVPDHLPLDGQSFKNILFDPEAPANDRLIFTMPVAYEGAAPSWPKLIIEEPQKMRYDQVHAMVQGPRFVYHSLPRGEQALYDMQKDPGETTDVSAQHPEITLAMAQRSREKWEALLASDRCFRMPVFLVGDPRYEGMKRCWAYLPPNTFNAGAAQRVTGTVTCRGGATGFSQPGDSATYAVDIRTAGTYRITIKGNGLDQCAPLMIQLDGHTLKTAGSAGNEIDFGTVRLNKGVMDLSVLSDPSSVEAKSATLQEIAVIPVDPEPELQP
jgi:arylsulfatase A-like enzyme